MKLKCKGCGKIGEVQIQTQIGIDEDVFEIYETAKETEPSRDRPTGPEGNTRRKSGRKRPG